MLCGGSSVEEGLVGRYRRCSRGGHRLPGACAEGAGIRGAGALGVEPAAGTAATGVEDAGWAEAGATGCAEVMVRPWPAWPQERPVTE